MPPENREALLQVRMSDREKRMLSELADLDGITSSEFIRQCVRREHVARFGAVRPKGKKAARA